MKVVGVKYGVEFDFVDGQAMDVIFFNNRELAEEFAAEVGGIVEEYIVREC